MKKQVDTVNFITEFKNMENKNIQSTRISRCTSWKGVSTDKYVHIALSTCTSRKLCALNIYSNKYFQFGDFLAVKIDQIHQKIQIFAGAEISAQIENKNSEYN